MGRIDVDYKIIADSIFDYPDDELVDFWHVGRYFFYDVDVLVPIIDLLDQIAEIERL